MRWVGGVPPRGYRSITVREETYLALEEEAARRGLTVPKLLDEIVKVMRGGAAGGDGGGRGGADASGVMGVEERLRRLEEEVARLRRALYDVIVTLDIMRRGAGREQPGEG